MRDNVIPSGPWEFDAEVAGSFDDMLARSIPGYSGMRETVSRVAAEILRKDPAPRILDLGASRGEAIIALDRFLYSRGRYTAVEVAPAMLDVLNERFGVDDRVNVLSLDLRTDFPEGQFDLVLAVLTVLFTPIEYRHAILRRIYESLTPGGAFIFVEKVLGPDDRLSEILTAAYYGMKRDNGYTEEQIETKRTSLEGVLVPVTAAMNESFLLAAGFERVEMIWRSGPFAGWVALK